MLKKKSKNVHILKATFIKICYNGFRINIFHSPILIDCAHSSEFKFCHLTARYSRGWTPIQIKDWARPNICLNRQRSWTFSSVHNLKSIVIIFIKKLNDKNVEFLFCWRLFTSPHAWSLTHGCTCCQAAIFLHSVQSKTAFRMRPPLTSSLFGRSLTSSVAVARQINSFTCIILHWAKDHVAINIE